MVKETYLTRILKMDAPKIMGTLKKKKNLPFTQHRIARTHVHTQTQHSHERNKISTYC